MIAQALTRLSQTVAKPEKLSRPLSIIPVDVQGDHSVVWLTRMQSLPKMLGHLAAPLQTHDRPLISSSTVDPLEGLLTQMPSHLEQTPWHLGGARQGGVAWLLDN